MSIINREIEDSVYKHAAIMRAYNDESWKHFLERIIEAEWEKTKKQREETDTKEETKDADTDKNAN